METTAAPLTSIGWFINQSPQIKPQEMTRRLRRSLSGLKTFVAAARFSFSAPPLKVSFANEHRADESNGKRKAGSDLHHHHHLSACSTATLTRGGVQEAPVSWNAELQPHRTHSHAPKRHMTSALSDCDGWRATDVSIGCYRLSSGFGQTPLQQENKEETQLDSFLKGLGRRSGGRMFTSGCSVVAQRHVGGIKPATGQSDRDASDCYRVETKRERKGKGHASDAEGHLRAGLRLRPPACPSTRLSVLFGPQLLTDPPIPLL